MSEENIQAAKTGEVLGVQNHSQVLALLCPQKGKILDRPNDLQILRDVYLTTLFRSGSENRDIREIIEKIITSTPEASSRDFLSSGVSEEVVVRILEALGLAYPSKRAHLIQCASESLDTVLNVLGAIRPSRKHDCAILTIFLEWMCEETASPDLITYVHGFLIQILKRRAFQFSNIQTSDTDRLVRAVKIFAGLHHVATKNDVQLGNTARVSQCFSTVFVEMARIAKTYDPSKPEVTHEAKIFLEACLINLMVDKYFHQLYLGDKVAFFEKALG